MYIVHVVEVICVNVVVVALVVVVVIVAAVIVTLTGFFSSFVQKLPPSVVVF